MDLPLNSVLNLSPEEIANSKIELNMREGKDGSLYRDIWLSLSPEERGSGLTACSYWGWYGRQRNFVPGQTVFSFIELPHDEWLFVSAAKIVDVPPASRAVVDVLDRFRPLFGRLVVKHVKGPTYSRYVFDMGKRMDACTVKEVLPCPYSGEQFEGYDNVHLPYGKLSDVFNGRIMPTYYEALKKITGVYCLTDTHTGKLYIGSATGGEGVAQRWGSYLDSKHGGNKRLIDLCNREGEGYFEEHFTFTLLEYFGLSYDPDRIKRREQYWKKSLDTIEHGYNEN